MSELFRVESLTHGCSISVNLLDFGQARLQIAVLLVLDDLEKIMQDLQIKCIVLVDLWQLLIDRHAKHFVTGCLIIIQ